MASDEPLSARALLQAMHELHRRGSKHMLEQLDDQEPELAEHLMESLSLIHRDLLAFGGSARASEKLYREVQDLMLTVITALRQPNPSKSPRNSSTDDEANATPGP